MNHTPLRVLVARGLQTEMQARNISIEVLSECSGVPLSVLGDMITGHAAFSVDELDAVATALKISVPGLLGINTD